MPEVKALSIKFPASASPDVTGYKLYMSEQPTPLDYSSPSWDLGNVTEIDISTLDGMTTKSGTYDIGIVAVDGAGNESSMSIKTGVVIDFVAPDPPGALEVIRA
jgi:hypothetical protein